jgi:hypothetical protein
MPTMLKYHELHSNPFHTPCYEAKTSHQQCNRLSNNGHKKELDVNCQQREVRQASCALHSTLLRALPVHICKNVDSDRTPLLSQMSVLPIIEGLQCLMDIFFNFLDMVKIYEYSPSTDTIRYLEEWSGVCLCIDIYKYIHIYIYITKIWTRI